ncbi:MAG: prolipoprotein diacylglyceryl transferase [Clostridia bacterium]|nr:prolipoprotein diacylglyceryl transferase [Clostridia bacterium]
MTPVAEAGPFQITPYSLLIFLGALLGTALCIRKKEVRPLLPWVIGFALILGHICWCLLALDTYAGEEEPGLIYLMPWKGGYTLYGALAGGMLGAWIGARINKTDFAAALDALTPGAAAAICLGRLGEYFSGQGFGSIAENEGHQFFPLAYVTAREEDYLEWAYAVWFWEACAALIILAVLLAAFSGARRGSRTVFFLTALGLSQIWLEQFRADDYLRINEFVRFTQIAALIFLLGAWVFLIRDRKPKKAAVLWSLLTLIAAAGVVIAAEFVFDKPQHTLWLYIMTGVTAAVAAGLLIRTEPGTGRLPAALFAMTGLLLFLLHALGEWETDRLLLYAFMGWALTGMAIAVARCAAGEQTAVERIPG